MPPKSLPFSELDSDITQKTTVYSYLCGNFNDHGFSQRGPKKCTHSLSAAITPDTLTTVFAQQFGGIDAV
jgi:hypothetical protein